jgi:secreted trypsin-like serine protease
MIRATLPLIMVIALLGISPAHAIKGGVLGPPDLAAQTVMIVSTRASICTGSVIARNIVLTAAHCVQPKADYAIAVQENGATRIAKVSRIVLHPKFNPNQFRTRHPTPDMAILKISEALPLSYRVAQMARDPVLPKHGEMFVIAGYGFSRDGDEKSLGKLRSITLPAIGTTGGIMVRLSAGDGVNAGACTGDSGGPAFHNGEVAGVIGWLSAPSGKNCGFVTGVTLVGLQRVWIDSVIRSIGTKSRN